MFSFKQFSVRQHVHVFQITTDALLLGAIARLHSQSNALEVGTGTGIISLMLAQRFPGAHFTAIDINAAAVQTATGNFNESPFAPRLRTGLLDFNHADYQNSFDDVISNPPFFESGNPSKIHGAARHQNSLPLENLITNSAKAIKTGGRFHVITPLITAEKASKQFEENGLFCTRRVKVRHNPQTDFKRVVLEFTRGENPGVFESEFTVRNESGDFSNAYCKLMEGFHPFL